MQPVSASRLEELEAATQRYEAALGPREARYLLARGLEEEVVATSRVGAVTDPMPGHGRYRGMLAIPYLTADGEPLTIRFRCIEDHDHRAFHHGKYNSMPDEPVRMFNVGAVHRAAEELHIAEGEFDALILNQLGFPAVAIPGAQSWRKHHRRMVAGFSKVYVWGDPDEAGSDFVNKISKSVRNAVGVRLDRADGDVSELYIKAGAQAVRAKIL